MKQGMLMLGIIIYGSLERSGNQPLPRVSRDTLNTLAFDLALVDPTTEQPEPVLPILEALADLDESPSLDAISERMRNDGNESLAGLVDDLADSLSQGNRVLRMGYRAAGLTMYAALHAQADADRLSQ